MAHTPAIQSAFRQSAGCAQALPTAHGVQVPPQSTSVSLPLRSSSAQSGEVRQLPRAQMPLLQSEALTQAVPTGQPGHVPPPQSTRISSPSWRPSAQEMAAQTRELGEHKRLELQSPSTLQP